MVPFPQFHLSPCLGLLLLGILAYYLRQLSRGLAPAFASTVHLVALLLLGQLPLLLVLRLALPRSEAGMLAVLLLGGSVYVLHRLMPVLARRPVPVRWRPWLLGLAVGNIAGIFATLVTVPPVLPAWTGHLALAGGVAALVGLLGWAHWTAARVLPLPAFHRNSAPTIFPTVAAAQRAYYRQAKLFTPGPLEYLRWFHLLPAASRSAARLAGPTGAWIDHRFRRSFRHFVLENRGHRYVDFLADHLDANQFMRWVNLLNLAAPDDASLAEVMRR